MELDIQPLTLFDDVDKIEEESIEQVEEQEVSEEQPQEEYEPEAPVDEDVYPQFADKLADLGYITEIPEDVDPEKFDSNAFWKTLEHNFQRQAQEAYERGLEEERQYLTQSLSPLSSSILDYNLTNPNTSDEDILAYVQAKMFENTVGNLNPDKESDAERIITEYYLDQGWSSSDIEEKILTLTESSTLLKEAKLVHPKLVSRAQLISQRKTEDARMIAEAEERMRENLSNRVLGVLEQGELQGIPLSREDVNFIYHAVLNEDFQVPIRGGKKVQMPWAEALMYQHRYDQRNGNLENLMLGLLVMQKGIEPLKELFAVQGQNRATEEMVRQTRFSNQKKTGTVINKPKQDGLFRLNLKQ
jgi:hypothetical protein